MTRELNRVRYTVVMSDAAKPDHGYRNSRLFWWLASHLGGYAELGLFWFLVEYFGRRRVSLFRPSELLRGHSVHETEWLFVGLPTTLNVEHLKKLRFSKMILYDSTDFDGINFGGSDKSFLLEETDLCLKNWKDDRWKLGCKVGLLPIKRPPWNNKLRNLLTWQRMQKKLWPRAIEKEFDVGFVARPTGSVATNERLRWPLEIKRERPELKLWGGLVGGPEWKQWCSDVDAKTLDECWLGKRKIGFAEYFRGLQRSKVALAPRGFAPWSYRHFEAIYAGCIVVTNDLSHYEFFIPFPRDGMVEVPDGANVIPAMDRALDLASRPEKIADRNLEYIETWLNQGRYSKDRSSAIERFQTQLETC